MKALPGVPPQVARLVRELLAAELLEEAKRMGDASARCKAGAANARRNRAPASHIREGLELAEAFAHAEADLSERVRVLLDEPGRRSTRTRELPTAGPAMVPLFDVEEPITA